MGGGKLHAEISASCPGRIWFAPAIYLRQERLFPFTEIIHETWHDEMAKLQGKRTCGGRARPTSRTARPQSSARIARNPELGAAYELIASQGAAAFYKGAIAEGDSEDQWRLGRQDDRGGPRRVFPARG